MRTLRIRAVVELNGWPVEAKQRELRTRIEHAIRAAVEQAGLRGVHMTLETSRHKEEPAKKGAAKKALKKILRKAE